MLGTIPLIGIMLIVYNILAFSGSFGMADGGFQAFLTNPDWMTVELVNDTWQIAPGDLLVTLTLFALFFEIVKSTSTTSVSIVNHGLSMLVFIVALVEFVIVEGFATSAFFIMTMMALVDVIAGFTVTIVTARRDIAADGLFGAS
jgi:hypothetical protein